MKLQDQFKESAEYGYYLNSADVNKNLFLNKTPYHFPLPPCNESYSILYLNVNSSIVPIVEGLCSMYNAGLTFMSKHPS
jgi:hypothetical protein